MPLLSVSCVPETQETPLGVWKSEEPKIIMYLKPEYRNVPVRLTTFNHLGQYYIDDYALNVFIFSGPGTRIRIVYVIESTSNINGIELTGYVGNGIHRTLLVIGNWSLVRGQLHLTLSASFRERLGVRVIVFDKLEDYPEIDPDDWITESIEHWMERRHLQGEAEYLYDE